MCLAIPGCVVRWIDRADLFARAAVQFGGVQREVNMQCVPEAEIGDYVLVHAGIAITRIDPTAAAEMLRTLADLDEAEQGKSDAHSDPHFPAGGERSDPP